MIPSLKLPSNTRQTVLITGGSQGMGRGLAKLCAQKGANVVIVARNVDKLKAALEYISVRPYASSAFITLTIDRSRPETPIRSASTTSRRT
jgi:3-dehydrosphinganine reductase